MGRCGGGDNGLPFGKDDEDTPGKKSLLGKAEDAEKFSDGTRSIEDFVIPGLGPLYMVGDCNLVHADIDVGLTSTVARTRRSKA